MSRLKSVAEVLKEMGFNPESKESTQFAFFKHLKKAAESTQQTLETPKESDVPQQLEFNFDGPTSWSETPTAKKISNR